MVSKMIDLHCHTTNSDGTWSTEELLQNAERLNLEVLSITDHDSVKSYIEINENEKLQNIYKGRLITGVELNCAFEGAKIEVLAYGFDVLPINKWLEDYYTTERNRKVLIEEFRELLELCKIRKIKIDKDIGYDPDTEYPVDVVYYNIIKHKENKKFFNEDEWNNKGAFFRACSVNKSFPLYRDFSKQMPSLEFIHNLIHENNGKVFLAHLYKYYLEDHMKFLDRLYENRLIDGVEVYHSSFSDEEISKLNNYCKEKNLLISGGSDCHGEKKKERKLGIGYGNLNINKNIIDNWNI